MKKNKDLAEYSARTPTRKEERAEEKKEGERVASARLQAARRSESDRESGARDA